jgi:hypothetical protein
VLVCVPNKSSGCSLIRFSMSPRPQSSCSDNDAGQNRSAPVSPANPPRPAPTLPCPVRKLREHPRRHWHHGRRCATAPRPSPRR